MASPTASRPDLHVVFQEEQRVPGKPLGRHVVHDPRSRNFRAVERVEALVVAGNVEPRVKSWYRRTVWNQGSESSCTVQATGGVLVTSPFTKHLTTDAKVKLNSSTFRFGTYRRAQQLDPWEGEEPVYYGSSGLAACKALVEAGIVPTGWTYRWAFGGDEMHRILPYAALSVGTWWPEGFDRPDAHGRVRKTGDYRGGHQWEIIDYYEPEDAYVGLNSWGRGYAKNGRFLVPKNDLYELLEEDGDVVVWVP